ncbi:Hpt domain-containing protein [Mesorhizobium sp. C264A]|uniref:Hpt domain-containing protein n=1 Tax=Mesorhizobium sp. C264A TaxID=2956825 RepID=UPI0033389079
MTDEDFSQVSMLSLFQAELEMQSRALTSGLLALERDPIAADALEACMRAAHSLKGAARIIDLMPAVKVANAMEDCLVAAQRGHLRVRREHIDALLQGSDLLKLIASGSSSESANSEVETFLAKFEGLSLPRQSPGPKILQLISQLQIMPRSNWRRPLQRTSSLGRCRKPTTASALIEWFG